MVGTVIPSLIASDVVSVQAVDNRVGMVNIMKFVYGDTKGAVKGGDSFASPLAYNGMDKDYTSSRIAKELIAEDANSEKTVGNKIAMWKPIKAIISGGTLVDGDTGEYTPASGATEIEYVYDNESVPVQAPTMSMKIDSLPITTKARKLTAIWAFDAAYELEKEYGTSMQDILATQATAEVAQEIDNEITTDLYNIANAGPEITWDRTQPVGVSAADHYDSFLIKINEGSMQIFKATRRVHANFLICGVNVNTVLKSMRQFKDSEDLTAVGPHFVGTLNGIKCYVNPNYDEDAFILGYKGPNMMDAGYIYAPYLPITTTDMITLADDFASRQGFATMYGTKAINPRLYVKGRIS